MATRKPKRNPQAIRIDKVKLASLCQVHATQEEMAAIFGCSVATIERLKHKKEYAEIMAKGRADGVISLRRAQWQLALKGNAGMLIWLGKQILRQRDTVEHKHEQGPITVIEVRRALDGLSDDDFLKFAAEAGVTLPKVDAALRRVSEKPVIDISADEIEDTGNELVLYEDEE